MILNFKPSNNPKLVNSISRWKGIVVVLNSQLTGDIDVMFTGSSSKGTSIFATPTRGIKVYSEEGFMRTSQQNLSLATAVANSRSYIFSAGPLKDQVYIADENFAKFRNIPLLRLGGLFYITFGYKSRCIGVDDPSMLLKFASRHVNFKKLV